MIDLLTLLVRANLAAAIAIVAVALLRWPIRSIFGPAAAYRLWSIPCIVTLASLVPPPEGGAVTPVILVVTSGLPTAPSLPTGSVWAEALGAAWALGAVACAAVLAAQQLRFTAALRGGSLASAGETRVIRAPRPDVGPAVVGRTIILPNDFEARFTPAEQAAVIAHEAQHLARGDVATNAVLAVIQCLCWFNPLVHLAARWIRFDQELACDAAVIAGRPDLRRPYAEALLKTQIVVAIPPAGCAWRARSFPPLRDRILLLKQRTPSRGRRACGALVLAALTLGGGYTAWAGQARTPTVADPDWASRPNGADVASLYPREALARGLDGMAVMQCRVERTGALSACAIVREGPEGAGFGYAALQMAPRFQMKPKSVSGKPVAGGVVRIPIRFMVPSAGSGRP